MDDTCYKDLNVTFDRVKQNFLNFKRDSLSCFGNGRIHVSEVFMDLGFVIFVFLCCWSQKCSKMQSHIQTMYFF